MSHFPERKEKNCLNCGASVHGRFCHVCGQENIEAKQTFLGLIHQFIEGITHFDGKFFRTIKDLLFRPGVVPIDYVNGKRFTHLDPVRMYLFTSALFFLIFFSTNDLEFSGSSEWNQVLAKKERIEVAMDINARAKRNVDTFYKIALELLLDSTQRISLTKADTADKDSLIMYKGGLYRLTSEINSVETKVDSIKENSWLGRQVKKKLMTFNEKYSDDPNEGLKKVVDSFAHRLPYILFVSLPFFALILKLLYVRKKNFYYSDHVIFTLYHYIFSFILLLLIAGLGVLKDWLGYGIFGWLILALIILWAVYLYKGMKRFYGQSRSKTIIKFLLLNFLGLISIFILFLAFLFFSVFQI